MLSCTFNPLAAAVIRTVGLQQVYLEAQGAQYAGKAVAALGAAVEHLPQDVMLHVLRAFVLERHEGAPNWAYSAGVVLRAACANFDPWRQRSCLLPRRSIFQKS